jgi:hypothetical protein
MHYPGIDQHKDMCFITTIDETGAIIKQSKVPDVDHAILNFFFSLGSDHETVVVTLPQNLDNLI